MALEQGERTTETAGIRSSKVLSGLVTGLGVGGDRAKQG
jgi:hypothetical protein